MPTDLNFEQWVQHVFRLLGVGSSTQYSRASQMCGVPNTWAVSTTISPSPTAFPPSDRLSSFLSLAPCIRLSA